MGFDDHLYDDFKPSRTSESSAVGKPSQHADSTLTVHHWGDGPLPQLNERIKAARDPNGILAPGKQGIRSRPS